MTKVLTTVGLFTLMAGVALADPSIKLVGGGAANGKTGTVTVMGILGGATALNGAEIHIKIDEAKVSAASADAAFTAAAGWTTGAVNKIGNELVWVGGTNATGMTYDGPIVYINLGQLGTGASTVTLTNDSNVADKSGVPYYINDNQNATFLPGASAYLGGTISGAVTALPGGRIAAAVTTGANTVLKVVDLATMSVAAGTPVPGAGSFPTAGAALGGPINGRPYFGYIGGTAVIATSDTTGKITIVDAGLGATGGGTVSTFAPTPAPTGVLTTPLVDGSSTPYTLIVGETTTGSPVVHRYNASGTDAPISIAESATKVSSDPVGLGTNVAIGSDTAFISYNAAGTPVKTITDTGFNKAPVANTAGTFIVASATKVYRGLLSGGANDEFVIPTGAAPLSDPFSADGVTAYFGGADGKIYSAPFSGTLALAPVSGVTLPKGVSSSPMAIGGTIYAMDSDGNLMSDKGLNAPMGDSPTRALVATGAAAGNSVVGATLGGTVFSLPF